MQQKSPFSLPSPPLKSSRFTLRSDTIFDNWNLFTNNGDCFCFMLKAQLVLEMITFLCLLFGYAENRLDKKVKGYLRWKTITSQNVSCETQVQNFLFHKKIMLHFQDIQVFVFLTILWFPKSVTWWVLVHKIGCIFEYIFWTRTH